MKWYLKKKQYVHILYFWTINVLITGSPRQPQLGIFNYGTATDTFYRIRLSRTCSSQFALLTTCRLASLFLFYVKHFTTFLLQFIKTYSFEWLMVKTGNCNWLVFCKQNVITRLWQTKLKITRQGQKRGNCL